MLQLQEGVDSPERSPCASPFALVLNLALWGAAIFAATASGSDRENANIALAVAGLAYAIEALCSPVQRYLWRLDPVEDVVAYLARVRETAPELGFSCECSHMETRMRMVTDTFTETKQQFDPATNSTVSVPVTRTQQRMETYQERVVTHSETRPFSFSAWDDVSAALTEDIYRCAATAVDCSKGFEFGDPSVEERYQAERGAFILRNKGRDATFDFTEYFRISGFQSKLLSVVDLNRKSPLLHWFWFAVATLAGLSWLYRLWFDRNTTSAAFHFQKRILR